MKKVLFILLTLSLFTACMNDTDKGPAQTENEKTVYPIVKPIEYGNNVYYFNCTQRQFARSLADFLSDSTKHVVGMTGDASNGDGYDTGYFVVIEKR